MVRLLASYFIWMVVVLEDEATLVGFSARPAAMDTGPKVCGHPSTPSSCSANKPWPLQPCHQLGQGWSQYRQLIGHTDSSETVNTTLE